tara:strand:- start:2884 stop:3252 length:369 start_codon:yes stop_codon:yes gene_type:complete
MTQMSLNFSPSLPGSLPGAMPRARAHRDDTAPAQQAAAKHNRTGKAGAHAQIVLRCVKATPGLTAAEIGQRTGLGHVEAQRRLSDLKRGRGPSYIALVEKGVTKICTVKGSNMTTWHPTEYA